MYERGHAGFTAPDCLRDGQPDEGIDQVVLAEVDDGEARQRDVDPSEGAVDGADLGQAHGGDGRGGDVV